VALLVAGGIVAAVLLSGGDDKKQTASTGSPTTRGPASSGFPSQSSGGAQQAFDTLVSAFNAHNLNAVRAGICADASGEASALRGASDSDLAEVGSVKIVQEPDSSGSSGKITITESSGDATLDLDVQMANESGGWCVKDLETSGGSGSASGGSSTPTG
jgi:hypothetical protein